VTVGKSSSCFSKWFSDSSIFSRMSCCRFQNLKLSCIR
jgi:hypothetical protein